MPEETDNSNLNNENDKIAENNSPKPEEKNSSTSASQPESLLDDNQTDKAVDEITRKEGDELLAVQTEPKTEKKPKRWYGFIKNKKFIIPTAIVILLAAVFAVPFTRYKILGLFLKEKYSIVLTDSQTGKPVTDANINIGGSSATTNSHGQASLKVKVGNESLTISKKYYKTLTEKIMVPLSQKGTAHYKLQATGRQVPLKVVNLITGAPIANVQISADGTRATTDSQGQATMVLPANQSDAKASFVVSGYNNSSSQVQITSSEVKGNTFKLTPSGKIYFLSNLSGNIDVVSTNLDGTNRQTVLAGTGNEDPNNTVLLATRDWKYLALLSKRDGGQDAKLFLINTSNNQLTTIDEGAYFTLVGWNGHNFVYQANPDNLNPWQTGYDKIKSYNADNGKLTTIDQSTAQGTQNSYTERGIGFVDLVGEKVVYGLTWSSSYGLSLSGKKDSIMSANPDGSGLQDLQDISLTSSDNYSYMSAVVDKPDVLYVQYSASGPNSTYYVYKSDNNSVSQSNTLNNSIYNVAQQNSPTYLESPSGNQTFWSETRDGKNSLFIGDYYANNAKQIASLSDYTPYGWYSDNYLLVEKSGSELYIMPKTGGTAIKISDYYKPAHNYYGYGGGYGGL